MNLKLLQGLKKIVYKFHGDPTVSLKVISEKQCYAAMKYIVVSNYYLLTDLFQYSFMPSKQIITEKQKMIYAYIEIMPHLLAYTY